jgi:short-subunit dehydrogenase
MFSRTKLPGLRIILTGGSSGIGRALALQLAQHQCRLVLAARNAQHLASLEEEIRTHGGEALAMPTDVADPAERSRLIESAVGALGGLDVLVNNAGAGAMGFFAAAGEDRLRRLFETNFFAATELTRLALPHLRCGRNPMIVNVGSVIGRRGVPGCSEYCATKFALSGWSESLRAELADEGVHVLLASPGYIESSFKQNLLENQVSFAWQNQRGMSSDRCAKIMVTAIRRRKNEVVITNQGKLLLWLNRFVPRLVDALLVRYARSGTPAGSATSPR